MWEQILYLGHRYHLRVVSFIFSEEEYAIQEVLAQYCDQAIMVMRHKPLAVDPQDKVRLPRLIREYGSTDMRRTLEAIRAVNFDIVLIEHIFMAQYRNLFTTHAILQEHNIESNVLKRFAELRRRSGEEILEQHTYAARAFQDAEQEWPLMAGYENQTWPEFPLRITVSETDKREIERRCAVGRTIVIENGVDTLAITPVQDTNSRRLLFMGTMDYYPNIDGVFYFAEDILPRIWQKDPTISLCVAGRNPTRAIRQLASEPRIDVLANPEEMSRVARGCSLTVVPIRFGGGTRVKILHSMAMGLPVVSTSLGCEGLSVVDGLHILIRDEPDQFADAVLQIISNPSLRNHLRMNGRRLVEERYDWRFMFRRLEMEMLLLVGEARR
jgi:glycosyltransferase involved in cell wall biosynthesis